MPRYTKRRALIEAKKLSKAFLEKGSGTAIAKARGTSRQNENERLRRKPVQDIIQATLNSSKYKKRWLNEMLDGAHKSKKLHGKKTLPDRFARHRYLHDLGVAMNVIKPNDNGKGTGVIIIQYGYRSDSSPSTLRDSTRQDSL